MAKDDVKLIGAVPSPFVLRTRIALNLKSIQYEFLEEKFGSKSQLLLQSNPVHKKIPVLIHGGKPICESLIIVEYIDEIFSSGPSILPSDPYDRATARFWAAYLDGKWFPTMRALPGAQGEEKTKELAEQVVVGVVMLEEAYVKCNKGKTFFGGDEIGYLDIAFGSFLGWIRALQKMTGVQLIDAVNTPGLVKWADAFSSHSAVKDVLPQTDKLIEFAKVLAQARRAAAPPTN